jgi:tetratricopeptide (TPR) repeat protein
MTHSDDSLKKDGLDIQLESSFQSSFRSTSTNLKIYSADEALNHEASGAFPQSANRTKNDVSAGTNQPQNQSQNSSKHIVSHSEEISPPAGRHAPHHSWLLGSHGGKKKPQAVRTRGGASISTGMNFHLPVGQTAPQGNPASPAPLQQPPAGLGSLPEESYEHPNLYAATVEVQNPAAKQNSGAGEISRGSLPEETYEQPDLYAPTVEVQNPTRQNTPVGSKPSADNFDETVAHLYSQTVDVNKPGRLTRFPEEPLNPQQAQPQSPPWPRPEAPKFGELPSFPGAPGRQRHTGTSNPVVSPGSLPPPVPLHDLQSQLRTGQSNPQFRTGQSNPQFRTGQSIPQFSTGQSNPAYPNKQPPQLPSEEGQFKTGSSKSSSEKEGWSPHFGTPPTMSQEAPPPPKSRRRGTKASELEGDGSEQSNSPRKARLNSYIDRQIGNNNDQPVDDDDNGSGPSNRRKIGLAIAAVVGIIVVGVFGYQVVTGGGASWMPFGGSDEWKSLNTQADEAMAKGNYPQAISYLDSAIKSSAGQAVLYHRRGLAKSQLHKRELNESALTDFDLALKKDPKLFEAYLDRAAVRVDLGQFEQAIEDYDRLIESGKDTDKVRYGRGLAKYYAGEYAEAEIEFTKILHQNPDNVEAAIALGTTLYKSKSDKKGAEEQFVKATKLDKSGLADRNLGIISYESGAADYQEARKFYTRAIESNSNDANLFNERGVIGWLVKDPVGATKDFRSAVRLDPNLDTAVRNLDFVAKSLIGINPKSEIALTSLIELSILKKRWSDASNFADQLIESSGWKSSGAYSGVLLKWVALKFEGNADKAQDVLNDCKMNAGNFGWPMPLVKYLSTKDKGSFSMLEGEAEDLAQRTAAHYYAGMSDYFANKPDAAKEKLEWVIRKGSNSSFEGALARRALDWIAESGSEKSEKGK